MRDPVQVHGKLTFIVPKSSVVKELVPRIIGGMDPVGSG